MRKRQIPTITSLALALVAAVSPMAAQAKVKGPFVPVTEWFAHDLKLGCINTNADRIPCPLTVDDNFRLYKSSDSETALVIIEYLPDATGNAGATAGAVVKLSPATGTWQIVKRAYYLGGQEPEHVKFDRDSVSLVLKTFRPTDGRCCPSGHKTIKIPIS